MLNLVSTQFDLLNTRRSASGILELLRTEVMGSLFFNLGFRRHQPSINEAGPRASRSKRVVLGRGEIIFRSYIVTCSLKRIHIMYIRNYTSSLIFFAYWDRGRLPAVGREDACQPVGREERNAQISICCQLYSCLFCLLAK
jgi:hypothetical protein